MKANRTGQDNAPPKIENLGDGTFFYNFDIEKSFLPTENSTKVYVDWEYNQVRLPYPVDVGEIQTEINKQNYEHIVNIE